MGTIRRRTGRKRSWQGNAATGRLTATTSRRRFLAAAGATAAASFAGCFDSAAELDGGYGLGDVRVDATRWRVPVEGVPTHGVSVADGALFLSTRGRDGSSPRLYALE